MYNGYNLQCGVIQCNAASELKGFQDITGLCNRFNGSIRKPRAFRYLKIHQPVCTLKSQHTDRVIRQLGEPRETNGVECVTDAAEGLNP